MSAPITTPQIPAGTSVADALATILNAVAGAPNRRDRTSGLTTLLDEIASLEAQTRHTLAATIRERARDGESQRALAAELGLSHQRVNQLVAGDRIPKRRPTPAEHEALVADLRARRAAGASLAELAHRTGHRRQTISEWLAQ